MKVLVIGASLKTERYSNMAVKLLLGHQHEVFAIGNQDGEIDGVKIERNKIMFNDIDTITLYLNAARQKDYYEYMVALKPKRVIFNPGTENDELVALLAKNNISTEEACTLVLLRTGQF